MQNALGSTRKIVVGTAKWFDAIMDRSSDWFATQTRVWTVCLAFGLALFFKVDAFLIIRQLADNPEVRAKLVQNTDQVLDQAKKEMSTGTPAEITLADLAAEYHDKGDAKEKLLNGVPVSARKTCNDVVSSLLQQPLTANLRTEFSHRCEDQARRSLQAAALRLNTYKTQLDSSQLTIITIPFVDRDSTWPSPNPGWVGSVVTGLLLTLGAPFWFNGLKNLSNLRPAIAEKLDDITAVESLLSGSKIASTVVSEPAPQTSEALKPTLQATASGG